MLKKIGVELFLVISFAAIYALEGHPGLYLAAGAVIVGLVHFKMRRAHRELDALAESMEKVRNTISGTNEQIYSSCTLLDDSTNAQSSAIIQSSSASDEISAMLARAELNVKQVGSSVATINDTIELSSRNARMLEDNFLATQEANQNVIEMMSSTVNLLKELTSSFAEVVSKTAVINDIVFQTKLLSFNASVEAARAGEHGKGFAVVAEEIGSLAQMSGQSAKAINQTLEQTESKVTQIIERIKKSSEQISSKIQEQGLQTDQIMSEFKGNFSLVKEGTNTIAREVDDLRVASEEQSRGVSELRDAIHQVNESLQKNTLVVAQTGKLATVLNEEMKHFDKIIDNFKMSQGIVSEVSIDEIPWEERYALGIDLIDREHKQILDGINGLIRAMNAGDYAQITSAFESLKVTTLDHFADEEAYMESIGYPSLASHKKTHENLVNKLLSFVPQVEDRTLDRPMLASFLRNWLFTHIMGIDSKYAEHAHHGTHSHKRAA